MRRGSVRVKGGDVIAEEVGNMLLVEETLSQEPRKPLRAGTDNEFVSTRNLGVSIRASQPTF